MKVTRHVEIDRSPADLLDAIARSYEPGFIIPPSLLTDEGGLIRSSISSALMDPLEEAIRIAPAGEGARPST